VHRSALARSTLHRIRDTRPPFRRGGKATGGGNPRPDARPRFDRNRFRP